MANNLKIQFPVLTPSFTANYDFIDTFTGVGYIAVYPGGGMTTTTQNYFLTTNTSIGSDAANFKTSATFDFDFDLKIIKPFKIVAAPCFAHFLQEVNNAQWDTVVTLRHWDGSSETDLGSDTARTSSGSGLIDKKTLVFTATAKQFIKGDTLRITAAGTKSGANTASFYFDPSGRVTFTETDSSATVSSQFVVLIPVRAPF